MHDSQTRANACLLFLQTKNRLPPVTCLAIVFTLGNALLCAYNRQSKTCIVGAEVDFAG